MTFKPGQSGNPAGKPKGSYKGDLDKAIKDVEKARGMKLMRRAVNMAWDDTKMMVALLKKVVPDKTQAEVDLSMQSQVITYMPEKLPVGAPVPMLDEPAAGLDTSKEIKQATGSDNGSPIKAKQYPSGEDIEPGNDTDERTEAELNKPLFNKDSSEVKP